MPYVIVDAGVDKLKQALEGADKGAYSWALRNLALDVASRVLWPQITLYSDSGLPDAHMQKIILVVCRAFLYDVLKVTHAEINDYGRSSRCAESKWELLHLVEYLLSGGGVDTADTLARLLPEYEQPVYNFLDTMHIPLAKEDLVKWVSPTPRGEDSGTTE